LFNELKQEIETKDNTIQDLNNQINIMKAKLEQYESNSNINEIDNSINNQQSNHSECEEK